MIHVALLHSITLPDGRLVMSDLRDLAKNLGLTAPRTLLATGNLVFETDEGDVRALERRLEAAYAKRFDRHVDMVVRTAPHWLRTVAANPFPGAEAAQVMVRVQRHPLPPETIDRLAPYRPDDDLVRLVDGDLWVRFGGPPNRSRLLSALTTKRLGVGTSRIWNTARKLGDMLSSGAT